ncbi:nucleoside phosphorylase domain-containing protein [Paraphoma chrysanthemicola]|nr:nucleoside phosphorylase domain-containing protein [Paraphoma chrysanthemicola]
MQRRLNRSEYTVGWVCALPVELAAAQEMLDEEHYNLDRADNDENLYALGSIGSHNIAMVCLPAGRVGNNPAAAVATQMRATFKAIRFGLMVGIGGGVPSAGVDIRLGDVVVSQPHETFAGVVQYDAGKTTPSGFKRTGALNSPPQMLLAAVAQVHANEMRGRSKLDKHITKLESISNFRRSNAGPDVLFEALYDHEEGPACGRCSVDRQEIRHLRDNEQVVVHHGTIASGNQVMRSAAERDKVSAELGGVLCFEMEAAGLMNSFPCLVIRGLCDYADSHKNKQWQAYAAGTAAAYAKELLSVIPAAEITDTRTVEEAIQKTVGPQKEVKRPTGEPATASPLVGRTLGQDHDVRHGSRFGCETCGRTFQKKEAVNQHALEKKHWPRCKCRKCEKEFGSDQAADQHRTEKQHWPANISCQICHKEFLALSAAYQHQKALGHQPLIISCKVCPEKFRSEVAAKQHMRDKDHLVV